MNLSYPPHVVALGCLYLAALLSSFEQSPSEEPEGHHSAHDIATTLGSRGSWEQKYQSQVGDLEGVSNAPFVHFCGHVGRGGGGSFIFVPEIAHAIIDLLIAAAQNPQANTSPSTPSSPSPHLARAQHAATAAATSSSAHAPNVQTIPPPYTPDQLIRMKIAMRETEHPPRYRQSLATDEATVDPEAALLGRNEGTVRFLFGPPGSANASV